MQEVYPAIADRYLIPQLTRTPMSLGSCKWFSAKNFIALNSSARRLLFEELLHCPFWNVCPTWITLPGVSCSMTDLMYAHTLVWTHRCGTLASAVRLPPVFSCAVHRTRKCKCLLILWIWTSMVLECGPQRMPPSLRLLHKLTHRQPRRAWAPGRSFTGQGYSRARGIGSGLT